MAPHPDRSRAAVSIEVRNGMRPPLARIDPLSPEEWADEFFSKAPKYRTKQTLVELFRLILAGKGPRRFMGPDRKPAA